MNKLQLPFMRVLHNTLVNITNEHMGSQSVLFEGSDTNARAKPNLTIYPGYICDYLDS